VLQAQALKAKDPSKTVWVYRCVCCVRRCACREQKQQQQQQQQQQKEGSGRGAARSLVFCCVSARRSTSAPQASDPIGSIAHTLPQAPRSSSSHSPTDSSPTDSGCDACVLLCPPPPYLPPHRTHPPTAPTHPPTPATMAIHTTTATPSKPWRGSPRCVACLKTPRTARGSCRSTPPSSTAARRRTCRCATLVSPRPSAPNCTYSYFAAMRATTQPPGATAAAPLLTWWVRTRVRIAKGDLRSSRQRTRPMCDLVYPQVPRPEPEPRRQRHGWPLPAARLRRRLVAERRVSIRQATQ
jgi:hypothetical protein